MKQFYLAVAATLALSSMSFAQSTSGSQSMSDSANSAASDMSNSANSAVESSKNAAKDTANTSKEASREISSESKKMFSHCKSEVNNFCAEQKADSMQLRDCLKSHKDELSSKCAKSIK